MNIEKVYFDATDGLELVGLLHKGDTNTKKLVIAIHGMTSNCLKKRDDVIANTLTSSEIDFFSFNNRGFGIHNYATRNKTEKLNIGTAFEDVEESYFDICGAIIEMKNRGYEEIYLQGHSLGCTKLVYTYNKLKSENNDLLKYVKAIILLSLVDIPRAQVVYLENRYNEVMNIALENEKNGNLEKLMPEKSFIHPITTKTYLRYFRDYKNIDFARYYDNDYKSDITFWINDKEICTLTTKGDYGDRRGKLNPDWWPSINTQYGELTTIKINENGIYLKDILVNKGITIKDLDITNNTFIKISLGNKNFALNKGGFNIFGSEFGDYPQNIIVEQIKY